MTERLGGLEKHLPKVPDLCLAAETGAKNTQEKLKKTWFHCQNLFVQRGDQGLTPGSITKGREKVKRKVN